MSAYLPLAMSDGIIVAMGPVFWFIIVFAVLAVTVIAERLFYFHRVNINSGDFLRGLSALLRSGQTT